jgi:hypothetical protein
MIFNPPRLIGGINPTRWMEAIAIKNMVRKPPLDDQHAGFRRGFVVRPARPGRQHGSPSVDLWLV